MPALFLPRYALALAACAGDEPEEDAEGARARASYRGGVSG